MNTSTTEPTIVDIISVVLLCFQTLATIAAVGFAWLAYQQTRKISQQQRKQTNYIHLEQVSLTKLQAFIPLSAQLSQIRHINLDDPHWDDVSNSANLLEVIAVAWEMKLINRRILVAVYGRLFIKVFEQIYSVKDQNTGEERGRSILQSDCPKTIHFYVKLCKYYRRRSIAENNSEKLHKGANTHAK